MRRLPLLAVLCLLVSAPAFAAEMDDGSGPDPRFGRGAWELSLRLEPNSGIAPAIAYYLANNFSLVVHLGFSSIAFENTGAPDDELNESELAAEAVFNIPTGSEVVPFVGVGGGVFTQEIKLSGTTTSDLEGNEVYLLGGLRFLVGTMSSINVYIDAGGTTVDDNLADTSQDGGFADLGVSYSLFFP